MCSDGVFKTLKDKVERDFSTIGMFCKLLLGERLVHFGIQNGTYFGATATHVLLLMKNQQGQHKNDRKGG
eukprot:6361635-Amphidinium_carterae.1